MKVKGLLRFVMWDEMVVKKFFLVCLLGFLVSMVASADYEKESSLASFVQELTPFQPTTNFQGLSPLDDFVATYGVPNSFGTLGAWLIAQLGPATFDQLFPTWYWPRLALNFAWSRPVVCERKDVAKCMTYGTDLSSRTPSVSESSLSASCMSY